MDQFTAHLDRGWDLVSRGDFQGALVSAEKGLELDAESPEAHNLLGFICQSEGRHDDALEHYRQALAFDDAYVEAMLNAAEVLIHGLKDIDAGLGMIDEALDLAEGDDEVADAQLLKLDAYLERGDREQAAKIAKLLPAGPFENEQLDFMVGRAKLETGDAEGAEPFLARARRTTPGGDAHYYYGLLCEQRGDPRGAVVCFLEARESDLRTPRPPWALPQAVFERQVRGAVKRLSPELARSIEDALVVVCDLPGPEVVAEGVDPHVGLLLDDLVNEAGEPAPPGAARPHKAGRLFIYQLNIERWAESAAEVEEEILRALEHELSLTFTANPAAPHTNAPE